MTPPLTERIAIVLAECERIIAEREVISSHAGVEVHGFAPAAAVGIRVAIQHFTTDMKLPGKIGCIAEESLENLTSPFAYLWNEQNQAAHV